MKRTYPMIIEQGDKGLFGYFPDLPGLTVGGTSKDELITLARDFMRDYLADYDSKGVPWPETSPAIDVAQVEITSEQVATASAQPAKATRR